MARIMLQNVNKVFPDGFQAVKQQNLDIKDGEFMVLVGPSGCGKSTTLNMIAGLEEITSGEIYIGDEIVNEAPPKDRGIAMVFQSYALYPHMNVYENMAFALKLRKYSKQEIETRVKEAAEILEISDLLSKKPKQLSGGQRQRVAVGRAIVRHPKVFLFDEPLSNLDAKLRVSMRYELNKLHQTLKTTMVYVTHDQMEAMTMGDRICVMNRGVIQQTDTPIILYKKPVNCFVAKFIGSPSMNIVSGKLIKNQKTTIFQFVNGTKLILDSENSKKLESYIDKEVYFGIRPENIKVNINEEKTTTNKIKVKVDVIEQMGSVLFFYFSIGNKENFISRVDPGTDVYAGKKLDVWFDTKHCHIFDKETELNIIL